MARDRLSIFLYSLTFYLVPWCNVFGPGSAFNNFAALPLFSVFGRSNVFGPRSAFKVFAIFASYLIRHSSLARDRPSRFLPILTSSSVGPCPGPGVLLANLQYAWARCRDGDKLDALVSTMVQGAWPDIGFQDFCSFSPSS